MNDHWKQAVRRIGWMGWAILVLAALPAGAQEADRRPSMEPAQMQALRRAADAVVGLRVRAVEDARSARSLGRDRAGSGIVIGRDGLVLTIGYLILEAESLMVVADDGRHLPARVVAYDQATGFGLVQTLVPLDIEPAPLGRSSIAADAEPLVVASGGERGIVSMTWLRSRRAFAGDWEYLIDGALFTSPPMPEHSGAGLFNASGELIGVGSLFLTNVAQSDAPGTPGNMFVPVDLLVPIMSELRARGRSAASARPWLGINCVEHGGQVRILRVNEDSPAELAELRVGDRILSIDGRPVDNLAALWKTLWADSRSERAVSVEIQRDGQAHTVVVHAIDRAKALRRPEGI